MDTITVYCGKCGKKVEAKAVEAGGVMNCPKCGVRIPIPSSNLDRAQIRVFCAKCGSRLRAWPEEAGKQVECRRCKKLISLPLIEREDQERPKAEPSEKRKEKFDIIGFTAGKEIEKEEVKVEPVKKRRSNEWGMFGLDGKERPTGPRKDKKGANDDEDGMISFDEFLVGDAVKPKKPQAAEPKKGDPRKPKLSEEDFVRSRRETDNPPPSKLGASKPPAQASPPAKTLVIECKGCGMRLVFKNQKPLPGAACPACGERLAR